jgi:hypothetical protein
MTRIDGSSDGPARTANMTLRRLRALLVASTCCLAAACGSGPDESELAAQNWAMLEEYCVFCHNSSEFTAGLALDSMSPDAIAEDAAVWEAVLRKLRGHMMPPPGEARPESAEVVRFVTWMEARLDAANPEPDPGHTVLHRLNRQEYTNAIRDLIALDIDPEELLPVDDVEGGFNNVASALQTSPTFIDQYLRAARNLSSRAIGERAPRPFAVTYNISPAGQELYVEGLPLGTRGGALIEHYFPADGEYRLSIGDLVTARFGINQEHVHTLIGPLDGRNLWELDLGGGDELKAIDQLGQPAVNELHARLKNIPFDA